MSSFNEIPTPKAPEHSEKNRETNRSEMRESDVRIPSNTEIGETPFSDSEDIFNSAFKSFGFTVDSSEKRSSDSSEHKIHNDYSDYLEKSKDGKYHDKETEKAYDSIEAWEKAQKTLAKRYDSTAKFYENKAKKEWARFKNSENNGESDAEKWGHYRHSQKYYAKTKEYKEKAAHTWAKLGKIDDVPPEGRKSEANE